MISNVFVYGSLKSGQCREDCWPVRPLRIAKAWIEANLYDLGPYPAIEAGGDLVAGELWEFEQAAIEGVLRVLDGIEECYDGLPELSQYTRQTVQSETIDGEQAAAYAYFYARTHELAAFRRIPPTYVFAGRRLAVWPEGSDW